MEGVFSYIMSHISIFLIGFVVAVFLIRKRIISNRENRQSNLRFRTNFENSPIPCSLIKGKEFTDFNRAALNLLGHKDKQKIVGRITDAFPQNRSQEQFSIKLFEGMIDQVETDALCNFEWLFTHTNGKMIAVEITLSRVMYQKENYVYCVWCDISDKKEAERKLKLAANVFLYAGEGIVLTDSSANIIEVNDSFCSITGYDRHEVIGKNPKLLQSGNHTKNFYRDLWQSLINEGRWSGEVCNKRKTGELYYEKLTISAIKNETGQVANYVAMFSDITQIKEYQNNLEHIAHYDALTGLPNKILLTKILRQEIKNCQSNNRLLVLAVFNLDGFKKINDKYNHDIGDFILKETVDNIKNSLHRHDYIARINGDEFAVLLKGVKNVVDFIPRINKILKSISSKIAIDNITFSVTASAGITIYPLDKEGPDQLLRHADQAMFRAKLAGKNRFDIFDVNENTLLKKQRKSIQRIQEALTNDEFLLYYQPKVNMKTGDVIGFEALIRWQHPELGVLPPGEFLPLIENHPSSLKLGNWVLETALIQLKEWQKNGIFIPVSVNIGAMQLEQNFVATLSSLLNEYTEIEPKYLELEILETSALEEITEVSSIINECCKMGVSFALDDFGTGYSSLTYLKQLPVDLLKIDQTFVRSMLEDQEDQAIVAGVINLAQAFKLNVIAEGVETVEQGRQLLQMGCTLGQGYVIAKPMPASEIPHWTESWEPHKYWTSDPVVMLESKESWFEEDVPL